MNFSTTKHVLFLALFFQISTSVFSQSKGMKFESSSFAAIKAKAKKEKKLIFIDCYTTWCGPCTSMSENTFPDQEVGQFFNKNFINAKFDMEEGEGVELSEIYDIQCYPNLLVLDADGNILHRSSGYKDAEEFIEFGKTAQNPEKRFSSLRNKYVKNPNNIVDVKNYLLFLQDNCLTPDTAAQKFLSLAKEADLNNPSNWSIIYEFDREFNGKVYNHVLKNINAFIDNHSKDSVKDYCLNVLYNETDKMVEDEKTNTEFKVFIKKVRESKNPTIEETNLFNISLYFYGQKDDWSEYISYAMAEGDKYTNENNVHSICEGFYIHAEKKEQFLKAEGWIKKYIAEHKQDHDWVMDISDELPEWVKPYNLDEEDYEAAKEYIAKNMIHPHYTTYAKILYKLKKKKEAAEYANIALEVAEKYSLDASDTEEIIEKIESL